MQKNFLKAIGAHEPTMAAAPVEAIETRGRKSTKSPSLSKEFAELREKYPNLGKPWSKEDDKLLTDMFKEEKPYTEIAEHFGRRPGAVTSRLALLGLIEDVWKDRRKKKEAE
jgi:hypothetical protein